MCVKDIYVDRYPDGRELEFQRTTICENGASGHPCAILHINRHRHRNISYDELSTQYILNHPTLPTPRTSMSPGRATEATSSEGSRGKHKRRASGLWTRGAANLFGFDRHSSSERKHKQRREKIVYVDEVPRSPRVIPTMTSPSHLYPPSPISPNVPPPAPNPPIRSDYISNTNTQSAGRGRPLVVDERLQQPTKAERSQSMEATRQEPSSSRQTTSPARTPQIVVIPDTEGRPRIGSRERREKERSDEAKEEKRRKREILLNNEEIRNRPSVPLSTPPRTSRRHSGVVHFEDSENVHDSRPSSREPVYTSRELDVGVGTDTIHARRRRIHSTIEQSIRLQGAVSDAEGGRYDMHGFREENPDLEREAALIRQWEEEELQARMEAEAASLERLRARQRRGPERRNTVALDDVGRRRRDRDRDRERVVYFEEPRPRW